MDYIQLHGRTAESTITEGPAIQPITISPDRLIRRILIEEESHVWSCWERDIGKNTEWALDHYAGIICSLIEGARAILPTGTELRTENDPDNGLYTGVIFCGTCYRFDWYGLRQKFLDQYRPGEKAYKPDEKEPASDSSQIPFILPLPPGLDKEEDADEDQ